MDEAAEIAINLLVRRAGLAMPDIRQISAERAANGTFQFTFVDGRADENHIVEVDQCGVTVHINVTALERYLIRVSSGRSGPQLSG